MFFCFCFFSHCVDLLIVVTPGIILCMCPANERWRYIVMWSLIACWAHIQNNPCHITDILLCLYIVSYTSKHQTSRWLLMAWCLFGVRTYATIVMPSISQFSIGYFSITPSRVPTRSLFPGKVLTFDNGSLGPEKVLSFSSFPKRSWKSLYFLIKNRLMNQCLMSDIL